MARTEATAVHGVPTEGPASSAEDQRPRILVETAASRARNAPPRDPALESPLFKAGEAGMRAALFGLGTQLVALALVSFAGVVAGKKRKKLEREYGWTRRPNAGPGRPAAFRSAGRG